MVGWVIVVVLIIAIIGADYHQTQKKRKEQHYKNHHSDYFITGSVINPKSLHKVMIATIRAIMAMRL